MKPVSEANATRIIRQRERAGVAWHNAGARAQLIARRAQRMLDEFEGPSEYCSPVARSARSRWYEAKWTRSGVRPSSRMPERR
jgi:hypothetical protein